MKKIKEPCRHWVINLNSRSCAECPATLELPTNPAADRDAHNARVLENMKSGYLPGMGETEENS